MHELKKNTLDIVNNINQIWVNAIQEAKKTAQPIDITAVMGKYSENMTKLDQHFRDAEERMNPAKKKGWGR